MWTNLLMTKDYILEIIKEKPLEQSFYTRNTLTVAKELLGCILVKKTKEGSIQAGKIVETEAYTADDPACHAYKGRTKRSVTLFKDPGLTYVYFTYGMYHCMNIVTEPVDTAGAVLIRALEPLKNVDNTNGPGKLCREMLITREHNELPVYDEKSVITVYKGESIKDKNIIQTTRIGISTAVDYPWRFYVKDNKWVSKFAKKIK